MCHEQEKYEEYKKGEVDTLTVKKKAKNKKELYYNVYFILNDKAEIMLKKQEGTLLGGMYELPKYDIDTSIETIEEELGLSLDHPDIHTGSVKHVFTHQVWYMEGYVLYTKGKHEDFVPRAEVAKLPMSKAMQKVYRQ